MQKVETCSDTQLASITWAFLFCSNNSHHHHHHHHHLPPFQDCQMTFYECSACTGHNVVESMVHLARWAKIMAFLSLCNGKTKTIIVLVWIWSNCLLEQLSKWDYFCTETRNIIESQMFNLFCVGGTKGFLLSACYRRTKQKAVSTKWKYLALFTISLLWSAQSNIHVIV